ncbi:MAG: hypothetical protein CVT73_01830 [Alphaproteobacteria bacterium HGW-Alphaproteobacteria-12]|nr:MAG: hypothetical protein CVT73_01830 [Alphaproteobacteria bacterium HGW-Alphaproteobacteria-12]
MTARLRHDRSLEDRSAGLAADLAHLNAASVNAVKFPRLEQLRRDMLDAPYEVCVAKARLTTAYLREQLHPALPVRLAAAVHYRFYRRILAGMRCGRAPRAWQQRLGRILQRWYRNREPLTSGQRQVKFAEALRHTLCHIDTVLYPGELIVGNCSSKRIGAPIHPDYGGLMMLPELADLPRRATNPIRLAEKDRRVLEQEVFPFWFNRSVLADYPLYTDNLELANQVLAGNLFVATQFSGISHVTPDYPAVVREGINGLRQRIATARTLLGDEAAQAERVRFLDAAGIALDALEEYAARWRAHLLRLAETEADAMRRAELDAMADVLVHAPLNPARSFHEALQAVMLTHVALHYESFQHGISFGRIDQYLYPVYCADRAAGRLTRERAVELIGCFLAKAAELVPLFFERATEYFSGLSSASGLTLGGDDGCGGDGVNELSFLFLHAYSHLRLRQPNLHVRMHPGTSPAFLDLCLETLKDGGGMPALFNDREIVPALHRSGVAAVDASNYAIVGCAEWGSPYNCFPAAGAIFVNLPMALVLALHGGCVDASRVGPDCGPPEKITDMAQLLAAVDAQLRSLVDIAIDGNNAIEQAHRDSRPTPLLSTCVGGCIERARDVTDGGADYNPAGCQGTGLADLADSLAAVEHLIFFEGRLTLCELIDVVDRNFVGAEALRAYIRNKIPCYGEDAGRAEHYAAHVTKVFCDHVAAASNPRGGHYAPGLWTMTTHQGFGAHMGALPDGRLAGEPVSNGVSPRAGWDRRGPTASLGAAAQLPSGSVANGYVLNQKLSPDFVRGRAGNQLIAGLLHGYFDAGGMQVQFNIIDPAVLIDAKQHPERHRDLVVRISGYSAYFNDLTEAMKDEIIARTLYCG